MSVTRSDQKRLAGTLAVLGTELEAKGEHAWDVMDGWRFGPRKAPESGERGGGGGEASAQDHAEEAKQRARAAQHFTEHKADLNLLDDVVQRILRRIDIAVPPNLSELKNRRTDNLDPITPTEAAIDGWCSNCWRLDQAHVPITVAVKSGLRYYRDLCRPCGDFEKEHGIPKPLEILAVHLEGKRMDPAEADRIIAKAKAAAAPKKSKKKGKGKKAA